MLIKEYRVCMPLSVEEYHIGQLYMIAKHSSEQSGSGEGIAVIKNEPCDDPVHGKGQYTEKHIYLSSRLPAWMAAWVPNIFHVSEKAWNYYPHTITEYTCLGLSEEELALREVEYVDIVHDEVPEKHYKPEEDLKTFRSVKTGRGPLGDDWKAIRDILLLGHRQAFAWIDEWHGMSMEDLRKYESDMQNETNQKVGAGAVDAPNLGETLVASASSTGEEVNNGEPLTPANTPVIKDGAFFSDQSS